MFSLDKGRDNRSLSRYKLDFTLSKKNEEVVMRALAVEYIARGFPAQTVLYEPVDPSESFDDKKVHITPDYYFWYENKKHTIEIKCYMTDAYIDEYYIKPYSILSMVKNRKDFPNGLLLLAHKNRFAVLKADTVAKYPLCKIDRWSNGVEKKGFIIPEENIQWRRWLSPLEIHTRRYDY
jgi:hypothetical protein